MDKKIELPKISKRDANYVKKTVTKIWHETPTAENPYVAETHHCHGYELDELIQHGKFSDTLFLLLKGEMPLKEESILLEKLMVSLINPGPRHPATRAAMNAGVGKTDPSHILPIGLAILGGEHLGGNEVTAAMTFFKQHRRENPATVVQKLLSESKRPEQGDWHIAPGFGSRFGSIDVATKKIADTLYSFSNDTNTLDWCHRFVEALIPHNMGWLTTGIAAAVFTDLGFHPRAGAGLFQICSAPGLLAHGLELSNKPITAMPFLDEEHYVIEKKSR